MSAEKTTKHSTAAEVTAPLLIGMEWVKPFADAPTKLIAEQLSFNARRLHAEADLLQNLADCRSPTEFFQQQTKFLQTAAEDFLNEAARIWKAVQEATLSSLPRP